MRARKLHEVVHRLKLVLVSTEIGCELRCFELHLRGKPIHLQYQ